MRTFTKLSTSLLISIAACTGPTDPTAATACSDVKTRISTICAANQTCSLEGVCVDL